MAKVFEETISSHKSIYADEEQERELLVRYSVPVDGANEETGMLVLVSGYGGGISSNVYRHIREDFADAYNLVVVQCDYFGSKYMQSHLSEEVARFLCNESIIEAHITWREKLEEGLEDFNDMGIMQALDIVTATLYVLMQIDIINTNRIMLFGTSHGGYLAHLSNMICPGLFSHLIDVSGYITPYYLNNERVIMCEANGRFVIRVVFDYLIKKNIELRYYQNLYDLKYLYSKYNNKCHIIAIQGTHDWMCDYREKQKFIQTIPNAEMFLIDEEDVDGEIFKDTNHGVGLDYIKFLNMYIPVIDEQMEVCNELIINDVVNIGEDICISYRNNRPEIEYIRFK